MFTSISSSSGKKKKEGKGKGQREREQGGVDLTGNKAKVHGEGKVISRERNGRIDPEKWEFNAKDEEGGREIERH